MTSNTDRRGFLRWATAGGLLASYGTGGLLYGRSQATAEARAEPGPVPLPPEIEPVVRLLEETPRERLVEEVAARIQAGLSYRELLAALLLAGVRNVQPRPSVGFKFHAVLAVPSVHLASLAAPAPDRWLPIFWALDYFKSAQAQDEREGNWTMPAVDEAAVPAAHQARAAFVHAMDRWDEAGADAAIAGLARTAGVHDIYELFFRYGARDFRSIGHKAIYVAGSCRTLQVIGWRYAEPVLRSLAYALLMHEETNPADRDAEADRPWRQHSARAEKIRPEWLAGKTDDGATVELLAALRQGSYAEVADLVVGLLNRGVAVQSIWDGLLTGAGELLVRQPGIVALHALTTSNALRWAFATSGNDETRRLLLLQNAAFLPLFREAMRGRGSVADVELDKLPAAAGVAPGPEGVAQILADIGKNPRSAAERVLGYWQRGGAPQPLLDAARRTLVTKGTDAHDYKFGSAVLEDCQQLSPAWQARYLAASVFKLRGSAEPDSPLVERIRAALAPPRSA